MRQRFLNFPRNTSTRREALHVGGLTALGLGLERWLKLRALQAAGEESAAPPRARACILLWLDGGPSHLETFDPKPEAPLEVRGPFRPMATRVPGIQICEHLPRLADAMDRIALIRSMTSPLGEHGIANHYLLTGYKPTPVLDYPSFGAVVSHLRGETRELPSYVAVPDYRPTAGSGFLGTAHRPFATGGDPASPTFRVRDLELFPAVTPERLARRRELLLELEAHQRHLEASPGALDPEMAQACRLVMSSEAKQAFDLAREPDDLRSRYGARTLGQSCLLARRLVERGVPFVTVLSTGWDTHDNLTLQLRDGYSGAKVGVGLLPQLDNALSTLLEDLAERGLLDSTLVVAMGEFGRTPKLNTRGGRDHWPRVFSVLLAGGGVRGGQVVGSSDAVGESPRDRPVTPTDLARTIYTLLGVDPTLELRTPDGRPVPVNQGGEIIREIL